MIQRRPRSTRRSPVRVAALLAAAATGCSLLVPLDYTGGTAPAGASGSAGFAGFFQPDGSGGSPPGQGGSGGTGDSGAAGTRGGTGQGAQGGGSATGGSDAGAAGDPSEGGEAGMDMSPAGTGGGGRSGGAGGSGGAGAGAGGRGGLGGAGSGGRAGSGGANGGMSGGGMAGNAACPGADLQTDPDHCGSCANACAAGVECLKGTCVAAPCDGLCAPASAVALATGDGYRADNIDTAEGCFEVKSYEPHPDPPSIICWNFASGRTLEVNGVTVPCVAAGTPLTMPTRAGGYCIQAGTGDYAWAGFKLPTQ